MDTCKVIALVLMLAGCSVVHTPREYNLWMSD